MILFIPLIAILFFHADYHLIFFYCFLHCSTSTEMWAAWVTTRRMDRSIHRQGIMLIDSLSREIGNLIVPMSQNYWVIVYGVRLNIELWNVARRFSNIRIHFLLLSLPSLPHNGTSSLPHNGTSSTLLFESIWYQWGYSMVVAHNG